MEQEILAICNRIQTAESVEAFASAILTASNMLENEGASDIANELKKVSFVSENRFSKTATHENMLKVKRQTIDYLESLIVKKDAFSKFSQREAILITQRMLEGFADYYRHLCIDNIHGEYQDL